MSVNPCHLVQIRSFNATSSKESYAKLISGEAPPQGSYKVDLLPLIKQKVYQKHGDRGFYSVLRLTCLAGMEDRYKNLGGEETPTNESATAATQVQEHAMTQLLTVVVI